MSVMAPPVRALAACLLLAASAWALRAPGEPVLGPDGDSDAVQECCCVLADGTPQFRPGAAGAAACEGAAAWAAFRPGQRSVGGWHQLHIRTSGSFEDEQQALALGFLEGWLTGAAGGGVLQWGRASAPRWQRTSFARCTPQPPCSRADCGPPHQRVGTPEHHL